MKPSTTLSMQASFLTFCIAMLLSGCSTRKTLPPPDQPSSPSTTPPRKSRRCRPARPPSDAPAPIGPPSKPLMDKNSASAVPAPHPKCASSSKRSTPDKPTSCLKPSSPTSRSSHSKLLRHLHFRLQTEPLTPRFSRPLFRHDTGTSRRQLRSNRIPMG